MRKGCIEVGETQPRHQAIVTPQTKSLVVTAMALPTVDLHGQVQSWGLTQDTQLFDYLQQFSNSMVLKTKALENDLEGLVFETQTAEVKLNNCFNAFLMLSNTQFVEHVRVLVTL